MNRTEMAFQFQTGSIKSDYDLPDEEHPSMFQFQTGSIKSWKNQSDFYL